MFTCKKAHVWLWAILCGYAVAASPVYNGATGHWYEAVQVPGGITWNQSVTNAVNSGGHLCTITSALENTFVASLIDISYYSGVSVNNDILGPWLGGLRHANQSNWQWVTGEPFTYSNWYQNQPDGYGGSEQRLQYYHGPTIGSTWGDHPGDPISGYSLPRGYVIEYDTLPQLSTSRSNGVPIIFWQNPLTGWVLETTPILSVTNQWTAVPAEQYLTNGAIQYILPPNGSQNAFFRLRR